MHLPWTQVANEVIDQAAPQLASALEWHEDLEVGEAVALRGLLCFIRWALGQCPTDRPPSKSALIPGPGAARLIALQMRYRGDSQALVEAMAAVRPSPIITISPEGIRVNGLDRYDQAWRKNFKDEAKVWDERAKGPPPVFRADAGRKTDGKHPGSDRQTQTQTQIEKQNSSRARAEPALADRPPVAQEQQQSLIPEPPLIERLDALHRAARGGRALEWGPARWRMDREREISARADQAGEVEVLRRARNALTHPRGQFPYLGVAGDLDKHWEHYAEPYEADAGGRPKADPHQGIVRGEVAPLPTAATHGAVWFAVLERLRETKPYIAGQLARLREVAASGASIQLEAPDVFVLAWAEGECRGLLEQMLAPRKVVLRAAPGSAGPAPPQLELVSGGGGANGATSAEAKAGGT